MGIHVNLKDYDNAIEYLQKNALYTEIYNNINSVLNNLDHNVLSGIREQLISSRDNINNAKFSVDDIKQKISKNKSTYEEIESRFGKSVIAAAAAGGVVASNQIKPNLNYNSNNIPTITKIEETGGFLSEAWNTVSDITKEAISGVQNIVSDIGDVLYNTGAKICDFFTSDDSKWAAFWKETAKKIEGAKAWASQVLKSTGASIANLAIGFSEGVAWVGEMVADTGAILSTAFECAIMGAGDVFQWAKSLVTGKEYEFTTLQKWDEKWTQTMEKVKESKVANAYADFYKNNEIGKWLDENAISLCKSTGGAYSLAKNLGTVAGNLGLSFLTFGVAGGLLSGSGITAVSAGQMASTAAFTGFGKGAESAWQKGATVTEGLIYGGFSGVWEGLQFYLGGKIGAPGGYGDKIAGKILNESATATQKMLVASGSRILLDTLDGAAEGFVQPILQTIYADGYYNDNGEFILFTKEDGPFKRISALFDDNGGWGTVGMQALTAGVASTFGELWNLRKYKKNEKQMDASVNQVDLIEDIEEKILRENPDIYEQLNEIQKLRNTVLPEDMPDSEWLKLSDDVDKATEKLFKLGYTNEELIDIIPLSTQRKLGIVIFTTEEQKMINEILSNSSNWYYMKGRAPSSGYMERLDFERLVSGLSLEQGANFSRLYNDIDINQFNGLIEYGSQQHSIDNAMAKDPELKIKLIEKAQKMFPGMTEMEAVEFLSHIDSKAGICTYASTANAIYTQFADNPNKFKEIFGFDMYTIDSNGLKRFNDFELLADMYLFENQNNTNIIKWNGDSWDIADSYAKQTYMINSSKGYNTDAIVKYLESKGYNIQATSTMLSNTAVSGRYVIDDETMLTKRVRSELALGHPLNLVVQYNTSTNQPLIIYRPDGSIRSDTSLWISGGNKGSAHAMFITGLDEQGNIIVSTWGEKALVKIKDLMKTDYNIENLVLSGLKF